MTDPDGQIAQGDIRASDRERGDVTAQLRQHCLDGRISVEELERRIGAAMAAQTSVDLRDLVADLPPVAPAVAQTGSSVSKFRLGVRPFFLQVVAPAPPRRTRRAALDTLAPALSRSGFELLEQSRAGLVFERITRPRGLRGWLSSTRERVVISLGARSWRDLVGYSWASVASCAQSLRGAQLLTSKPSTHGS
jgi:hypothetical protein